ncbi:CFEM domain-containing protein [Purpureocillium lavendulum]|uniref:CFEM domain-containing protein n=1 Tax=Purpureocillium lavendulum TaxID=1247861 RepID=A0AB34FMV1_9HYPO|nr:CFEM domain-containing protein [Purpureocillium lavendulum]
MRVLVALFVSLFALAASAIDLLELQKKLPECSIVCLAQGVANNSCSLDDFACQCHKLERIIKTVAPCLVKAGCDLENITSTASIVFDVCEHDVPNNVTLESSTNTGPAGAKATSGAVTTATVARAAGWTVIVAIVASAVLQ